MPKPLLMSCLAAFCLAVLVAPQAHAQAFTCAIAEKPVCLKRGETVAAAGTLCFAAAQCDARGFVCAASMANCTEKYQGLLRDFSDMSTRHDVLLGDFDAAEQRARDAQDQLDDVTACVEAASSLRAARACTY